MTDPQQLPEQLALVRIQRLTQLVTRGLTLPSVSPELSLQLMPVVERLAAVGLGESFGYDSKVPVRRTGPLGVLLLAAHEDWIWEHVVLE